MTNYNERLDKILYRFIPATDYSDKREADPTDQERAKQALTSLIEELVAEAKPEEHIDVYTYSNAKTNGDIRKIAIEQFEQNLLKALEEV